jgi:hypothetical protein
MMYPTRYMLRGGKRSLLSGAWQRNKPIFIGRYRGCHGRGIFVYHFYPTRFNFPFHASQTSPFPDLQMQILREASPGVSAKSVCLLPYPAVPRHLQMR